MRRILIILAVFSLSCVIPYQFSTADPASFIVSASGRERGNDYLDADGDIVTAPAGTYFQWVSVAVQNVGDCKIRPTGAPTLEDGDSRMGDVYGSYPLCAGDDHKFHENCGKWLDPEEICVGWSLFIVPDDVSTEGMDLDIVALEVCE